MPENDGSVPGALYKYLTANAARAILSTRTFRFSRPSLFNDEFDLQLNLTFEVDPETAVPAIIDQLWENLINPQISLADNRFGALIGHIRRPGGPRPSKSEFESFMLPTIREQVKNRPAMIADFSSLMKRAVAKRKILCLSATGVSPVMWGVYADSRKGLVLQLHAPPNVDTWLSRAKPVRYVDVVPPALSHQGFIDWQSGRSAISGDQVHDLMLYTKLSEWRHECEWRIVAGDGWRPDDEVEHMGFPQECLKAVIFGTQTPNDVKDEISEIARQHFPQADVLQLRRPEIGHVLEFGPVA